MTRPINDNEEQPVGTTGMAVTPSEAEYLLAYHLRVAAQLFEATNLNLSDRLPADEFSHSAMTAWVAAMEALYPED